MTGQSVNAGLQAELFVSFGPRSGSASDFGVTVLGDGSGKGNHTRITLSPRTGLVTVDGTAQGNRDIRAGPLPRALSTGGWQLHAIVDHCMLELIVNNITAMVVYVSPGENEGQVELFGSDASDKLDVWTLATANNNTDPNDELSIIV